MRVDEGVWGEASAQVVHRVLAYTASELLPYIGDASRRPVLVRYSPRGPKVLFRPGPMGETVVLLDTRDDYWAQYSFQFAHELTHVLAGVGDGPNPNLWFEEALCEAAALFALDRLSKTWSRTPPYAHWRPYSVAFESYLAERLREFDSVPPETLPEWFRQKESLLRRDPHRRGDNGVVALRLLSILQDSPEHLAAVAYLNSGMSGEGQSFAAYLADWHDNSPLEHRTFVRTVAGLFGVEIGMT